MKIAEFGIRPEGVKYRASRDDVTTGKLFSSEGNASDFIAVF